MALAMVLGRVLIRLSVVMRKKAQIVGQGNPILPELPNSASNHESADACCREIGSLA